jgi:CYTH domain-containing protein
VPVLQQRAILGDVVVPTTLDDDKTTKLFAWISRAFAGDQRYNNLMLACA